MHAARVEDVESLQRLGQHALAFGFGQRCIGFVMQSVDRAAVVVVAHPTLETRIRAGARVVHRLAQRFDREWFRRQRETRHAGGAQPPLTGGTNAISLPSTSASSQRANASSNAPRHRSTGTPKPNRKSVGTGKSVSIRVAT